MTNETKLYPLKAISEELGIQPATIRRWIASGRIAFKREFLPRGKWRYIVSLEDARKVIEVTGGKRGRPRKRT